MWSPFGPFWWVKYLNFWPKATDSDEAPPKMMGTIFEFEEHPGRNSEMTPKTKAFKHLFGVWSLKKLCTKIWNDMRRSELFKLLKLIIKPWIFWKFSFQNLPKTLLIICDICKRRLAAFNSTLLNPRLVYLFYILYISAHNQS